MAGDTLENNYREPAAPVAGLFDKIILAVREEVEFKKTGSVLLIFTILLVASVLALPFSWLFFMHQWQASAVYYFILSALTNLPVFFHAWQDFSLSILEALPVTSLALFAVNLALFIFCIRLFLYKKGALLKYLHRSFT